MAKHLLDTGQAKLGKLDTNQQLQCLGVSFDKDSGYDKSGNTHLLVNVDKR